MKGYNIGKTLSTAQSINVSKRAIYYRIVYDEQGREPIL